MERYKKSWPFVTIRIFAILNFLMGLVGLAALVISLAARVRYNPWPQDPQYLAQAYYSRVVINILFLVLTILAGVYLWRVKRRGWTVCKILFIGEILYFFIGWFDFVLFWIMGEQASVVSMAFGASGGTGNMGTAIQTITGYPVIALIGLKIAYSRLGHAPTSTAERAPVLSPRG